jgi:hypothetical protein
MRHTGPDCKRWQWRDHYLQGGPFGFKDGIPGITAARHFHANDNANANANAKAAATSTVSLDGLATTHGPGTRIYEILCAGDAPLSSRARKPY